MLSTTDLQQMKQNNEKITMVTAYDYPSAKQVEEANADIILVGDSLGMVVLGYDSTTEVTIEDMVHHGQAVRRGAKNTYTVLDMPFMSYHASLQLAIENATHLFQKTNVQALKIEGISEIILKMTKRLTKGGIPIVGHLGLTPQTVNVMGGYKLQANSEQASEQLLQDALTLEAAGAVALVLECIPKELGEIVTNRLSIPVIGIGAGNSCDGQVLVYHDILQYGGERYPKFVKHYADFNTVGREALAQYVSDVKNGKFPSLEHTYTIADEQFLPK